MTQSRREALRRQQQAQQRAKRLQRTIVVGAIVLGLVVVGVVGTIFFTQLSRSQASGPGIPVNATPDRSGIVVNPGKFAANAPKVEIFIDYQCPVCKRFEDAHGATVDDMATKGEIQLIYRALTFLDGSLRNDSSLKAGIAAACADNVGKYSAYHNAIFAGQPTEGTGFTTEQLRVSYPGTAGITGEALSTFQQCYDSRATSGFVEGTNSAASQAGVNSTPTIMVNGKKLDNGAVFQAQPDALRQMLLAG